MKKSNINNLPLKIFSVLMAIVLWSYVVLVADTERTVEFRNIPIIIDNAELEERGLVVVSPIKPTVRVKLNGQISVLKDIDDSELIARVDLSNYDEGQAVVRINIEDIKDIPRSQIEVVPKTMKFEIEKIIEREINIDTVLDGEIPKGYVSGQPELSEKIVKIKGPRSLVESVDRAVVNVGLTNETEDIKKNGLPITIYNKEGEEIQDISKDISKVDVQISVSQIKKVSIEPNIINRSAENQDVKYMLVPQVVEIMGKKADLDKIDKIKTKPIDATTIYTGMAVTLDIPRNTHLITEEQIKLVKEDIEVEIENEGEFITKSLVYKVEDMNLLGLGEGLKISPESLELSVELTVEGETEIINNLNESDFTIQLNLINLNEGEHIIEPEMKAKQGITLSNIVPGNLTIKLIREAE